MTDTSSTPLHTQNPRDRFSNRAVDYARYRPSYPAEAIDQLLDGLEPPNQLTVADVGAGTGISSRLLAERGATVVAIEPNAAMRELATPHPQVQFRAATAEQTGLAERSVDLVICAQSFHWFEPTATLAEFHRILKPSGRIGLLWNDRNVEDAFTRAYSDTIRAASDKAIFDSPNRKSASALETSPHVRQFRHYRFTHRHPLDQSGLIGLADSSSYVPKTGEAYQQLLINLERLFQTWAIDRGETAVFLSYHTDLYLAEPRI
ncbi:class I SAM-dependent methyltransferase [Oculatella sp. LEGE 06141]|nr:class I SAM-dependent methyltransferase [Oculatella sp. LEGE 06141]